MEYTASPPNKPTQAQPAGSAASAEGVLEPRLALVVCDDCSAVHERITLQRGQVARCLRCNASLGRGHVVSVQGMLAFALAALLFFIIGNLMPLVTLELRGVTSETTLAGAIRQTWNTGQPMVAILASATAVMFPLVMIVLRLYVLLPLVAGWLPRGFVPAMHMLRFVTQWSMVEVFMMGALVAIVRSTGLASVLPGMGLFAYGALTLLLTSITAAGLHTLWKLGSELQQARSAG
ncbi:MAG TPA: paraquat-inducible protein A [Rhizobacter sp.]|nr:paraquat-inducible protein A [Rhizobacter sp.]